MKKYLAIVVLAIACTSPSTGSDKCGWERHNPCLDTGCSVGTTLDDVTGLCATCGYELGPCCVGQRCSGSRTCMEALGRETSQICASVPACDPGGTGAGGRGAACVDNIWCCPGLVCLAGLHGAKQCQPDPGTCWRAPIELADGGSVGWLANENGACFHDEWCCPARWSGPQMACVPPPDGGYPTCQFGH